MGENFEKSQEKLSFMEKYVPNDQMVYLEMVKGLSLIFMLGLNIWGVLGSKFFIIIITWLFVGVMASLMIYNAHIRNKYLEEQKK